MRCLICGAADTACGAEPLREPVLGERQFRVVNAAGDVVDLDPEQVAALAPDAKLRLASAATREAPGPATTRPAAVPSETTIRDVQDAQDDLVGGSWSAR